MVRNSKQGTPHLARKTFADYIVDNFSKYERRGYYQRVIFFAKNKVTTKIMKEHVTECVRKTDENLYGEMLSGCCLYYTHYSIYMLEGLEELIGTFIEQIALVENIIFESAKMLIIINNIRKVFFGKFIFRTAEPPTILEKFSDDDESARLIEQNTLITRYLSFCREIGSELDDENDEADNEFLSGEYTRLLISTSRMEYVLGIKELLNLSYYLESFRHIPTIEDNDEKVWPIPYDYTPVDVFHKTKYDVNLTFPDADKRN